MTLERVQAGAAISAEEQNALVDQVNALGRPAGQMKLQCGDGAALLSPRQPVEQALFELVEALRYPAPPEGGGGGLVIDPTPWASARRIWCAQHSTADVAAGGERIRSYGGADHSPIERVWHPNAFRDPAGLAFGPPSFGAGDRVWCQWNRQSGRWEIVAPALNVWRVELRETFGPDDDVASVGVVDCDDEPAMLAHRPGPYRLGIGRAGGTGSGGEGHAGTLAYVIWSPKRGRWEFLCGQFKNVAEGVAAATIVQDSKGAVNLWWLDYPTGQMAPAGITVEALNWTGPTIPAGTRVVVSLDRQENRWTIVRHQA